MSQLSHAVQFCSPYYTMDIDSFELVFNSMKWFNKEDIDKPLFVNEQAIGLTAINGFKLFTFETDIERKWLTNVLLDEGNAFSSHECDRKLLEEG